MGKYNIINKAGLTALILTICLIVQGFMMSLHGPVSAVNTLAGNLGYQTVVLCSGQGSREITLDANGIPVDDEEMPMQGVNCPLCLASAHFILALPEEYLLAFIAPGKGRVEATPVILPISDRRPDNLNCLDPPLKA